jgi:hypothetical protein
MATILLHVQYGLLGQLHHYLLSVDGTRNASSIVNGRRPFPMEEIAMQGALPACSSK